MSVSFSIQAGLVLGWKVMDLIPRGAQINFSMYCSMDILDTRSTAQLAQSIPTPYSHPSPGAKRRG
jgi:hypothetical protein